MIPQVFIWQTVIIRTQIMSLGSPVWRTYSVHPQCNPRIICRRLPEFVWINRFSNQPRYLLVVSCQYYPWEVNLKHLRIIYHNSNHYCINWHQPVASVSSRLKKLHFLSFSSSKLRGVVRLQGITQCLQWIILCSS